MLLHGRVTLHHFMACGKLPFDLIDRLGLGIAARTRVEGDSLFLLVPGQAVLLQDFKIRKVS